MAGTSTGDKFFFRAVPFTLFVGFADELIPAWALRIRLRAMQHSVSIRNTQSRTRGFGFGIGNSEANRVDGLMRVLSLWPSERADRSLDGRKKLIAMIERALRQERCRGQGGHPAYDLERHAGLCRMLKEERSALGALQRCTGRPQIGKTA